MGGSTFNVGNLQNYETIGVAAPLILIAPALPTNDDIVILL
jgi:hypothetical protein